jgi:hypothetical protein
MTDRSSRGRSRLPAVPPRSGAGPAPRRSRAVPLGWDGRAGGVVIARGRGRRLPAASVVAFLRQPSWPGVGDPPKDYAASPALSPKASAWVCRVALWAVTTSSHDRWRQGARHVGWAGDANAAAARLRRQRCDGGRVGSASGGGRRLRWRRCSGGGSAGLERDAGSRVRGQAAPGGQRLDASANVSFCRNYVAGTQYRASARVELFGGVADRRDDLRAFALVAAGAGGCRWW